jgi:hypothetical protein
MNIKVEYIGTQEHIASIFTKPLPGETFAVSLKKTWNSFYSAMIYTFFRPEYKGREIICADTLNEY